MLSSPGAATPALVSPLTGLASIAVNSLSLAGEQVDGPLQDARDVFLEHTEVVSAATVTQQVGNSTFQLLSFGQNPSDRQVPGLKSLLQYIGQNTSGATFTTTKRLFTYITNETTFLLQKSVGATQAWVQSLFQPLGDPYWHGGSVEGDSGVASCQRGKHPGFVTRLGVGVYRVDFLAAHPNATNYSVHLTAKVHPVADLFDYNNVVITFSIISNFAFYVYVASWSTGSRVPVDQSFCFLVL